MMISRKPRIIRQNWLDSVPRLWLYVHDQTTTATPERTTTMARTTTRKSSKAAIRETDLTALLTQIAASRLVGVDTLET